MTDIIKEFENNGMVKVLKKAQDFDELQYNLLLKLFRDIALPLQKKELLEKILKDIKANYCITAEEFEKYITSLT